MEAIEFLLTIDSMGTILKRTWCQLPPSLDSLCNEGANLEDLFPNGGFQNLLPYLRQALATDQAVSMTSSSLHLEIEDVVTPLSLVAIPFAENRVLLLGIGQHDSDSEQIALIYNELINTMRQELKKAIGGRTTTVQEHFEEIQRLNNELINMSRQLEKAKHQLQAANQGLREDAKRDRLTGLLGQYQFWGDMDRLVQADPGQKAVFVFLDLDDFKFINDHFGHVSGDKVLIEFARRLVNGPWPGALKIRLSGDEFGLFFPRVSNPDLSFFATLWAQIQEHVIQEPIALESVSVPLKVSAGAAIFGEHTKDLNDLIDYADHAMYQAKMSGKNDLVVFDPEQFHERKKPAEYVAQLQTLLKEREFFHSFQPIVSTADFAVMGFCGFLRSNHTAFEDPRVLLATALQSGQDYLVEKASLQRLLKFWSQTSKQELGERRLFIPQGPYPGFHAHAIEQLADTLPRQGVVVEVPVSGDMGCGEYQSFVQKLRHWRCGIALKHFGAGRGPELRLLTMKPDFVKISAAIIPETEKVEEWKCLEQMVALAQYQGARVIMEDIETAAQLASAFSLGADYVQGFFLAHPGNLSDGLRAEVISHLTELREAYRERGE